MQSSEFVLAGRVLAHAWATSVWLTMPMRTSICLASLRSCVSADLVRGWRNVGWGLGVGWSGMRGTHKIGAMVRVGTGVERT